MTDDPHKALYEIWKGMCRRTMDPKRKDYHHYGGRGIRVCDQWKGTAAKNEWNHDGFLEFEKWAMAHGFRVGMTLDRANNNMGYSPTNCRWISKKAQAYNRQTNVYYTYNGRTMTAIQWSR